MARTTVDLDATVLKELKARARKEGKSLGVVISELAARDLKSHATSRRETKVAWTSRSMGLKVDLRDKEAVYDLIEGD
jgi:hypothetical protein